MAVPANEIAAFRSRVRGVVDSMRGIDGALAIVEDFGADDAARQAFFETSFGGATDNPDLTWAQFALGIVALRNMRTAWNTNKLNAVKLLK